MKTVAVILSGCGFLDGAEIRESVLTLLALDSLDVRYKIFAPDQTQHHVMNHLKGAASETDSRNILEEAARIARGEIEEISKLNTADFDALFLPGGFGVAKNFCTFAFKGSAATTNEKISSVIQDFNSAGKPIGAICIAPAIVSLALADKEPTVTVGSEGEVSQEIKKIGANHLECATANCIVDAKNKIVTTPAYMDSNAKLAEVYQGISKLVENTIQLTK